MKDFNIHLCLRQVLQVCITLLLSSNSFCSGIRLNLNGGYDIVIGIEDNVVEPLNVENFLDEISAGVEAFSTELWKATNRRFFINSVDVLVPANWWTVSKFDTATWQTFLDSEIRLSHEVAAPTTINPNPCGSSGLHIDLPDSFFKIIRGGKYGPVGKALVNLWARYRFGVWEEHGIPADTKFPYFYTKPSFDPVWEATGCSNEEIMGSFQTIDGEISDRCDPYGTEMSYDCRFSPSPVNSANSSLLHFHWLDSVTHFCDSKTHNHVAPNRQNLFCGHRSIWEVIRESEDYKSTKVCTETVSRPQFRVMKESRVPQLYILLDRGRTVTPEKVLKEMMGALVQFASIPSIERTNIAVGTYPHANLGKDHYYVKEEVGWAPIHEVIYDLQSVFANSVDPQGPVIRDFGLAIQEVAEKVKRRNHLAGTIILIVKRGAGPNLFDKIAHEQEVIASLKEDSRIKVFAIEAQQGDQMPYTNLQSLVDETSGQYHLINDTMNTARKLERILGTIQEILEQPSIMNFVASWVTQKQYTTPNEAIEIPIYDPANLVKIHLTTNRHMLASNIALDLVSGDHSSLQQTEKGEWDENSDLSRRLVFTYIIRNPKQGSVWSLKHGCNTEKLSECRFFLVVTAQNDNPTPRNAIFNSQSIKIDVSTSAEHNYVDMSHQGMKIVPFAIFAKIEMNHQRILGLENVTALVRLGGQHDSHIGTWTVELKDDGAGLPDVSSHDGIYSGVFTPLEDGLYQISVHANGVSNGEGGSFQDVRIVNQAGSLIAKDQYNFGCRNSSKPRCVSGVPRGSFSRVMDMQATVAVENAATFKPGKPMKILDFSVLALPNFGIEFGFTSPRLLGSDASPDEFRIYMAPHVDNFLDSTDLTKILINSIGEPAGSYVRISYNAAQKAIPFYAVEAVYGNQKGGPSNVVGVVTFDQAPIIPSPTTTTSTTSRPTTSLTTPVWPTESTTTESNFSTTTEESEETDPEVTSTTESSSTSTMPTTPSTTEESDITSTIPSSSSTSTTTEASTTEDDSVITGSIPVSSSTTSTTEAPTSSTTESDVTTSSTTEQVPTTTSPVPSSTEDPSISSTSPNPIISSSTTTTNPPETTTDMSNTTSTTTEYSSSTSTTSSHPITSDITDPIGSSTTTPPSSTPDEDLSTTTEPGVIPSSSTDNPSTTTETEISSSTTSSPITSTSTEGDVSASTTPNPSSTSTSTDVSTSSTTELPPITDITDSSSSTTTPSPSSSTENPSSSTAPAEPDPSSSSTTEQSPTTSTDYPSSSTTTTDVPSTTEGSTTSTTDSTELTSTSTENPISSSTETTSTSTTEASTNLSEIPPSSTTEGVTSSTTDNPTSSTDSSEPTSTATENPTSYSTSTTEGASASTTEAPTTLSDFPPSSTTEGVTSSTTDNPTSSTDSSEPTSTTTENPTSYSTSTTEGASTSTTEVPTTFSDGLPSSSTSTTESATSSTTTENPSTSTTTDNPTFSSTTSESPSSSSTTEASSTTSESPSSSSTTEVPTTFSDGPPSSSSTTESATSSTTTENPSTSSTTNNPTSSSTTSESPTSSSTTEASSTTSESPSSSSTTEASSTTSESPSSSSTTEASSTTSESPSSSSTTEASSTTSESPSSSSTTEASSTTSESPSSSSTTQSSTTSESSTTQMSSTSTETPSSTSSQPPSSSTPLTSSSSHSTSEQAGSSNTAPSATEQSVSSSLKMVASHSLIVILSICVLHCQRLST